MNDNHEAHITRLRARVNILETIIVNSLSRLINDSQVKDNILVDLERSLKGRSIFTKEFIDRSVKP